jgi:tRNA threonylcarbamoyladenosine biosynthesis protein TsaE
VSSSLRLRSAGVHDTRAIAAALAALLRPGDVVALAGELGAGKTAFVQGAAAALGVTERVTSPSFVLVKHYPGRLPVVHADVYRLTTLDDVIALGEEVLDPDGVTFLEWADAVTPVLPDDRFEVDIILADLTADDGERHLEMRCCGATVGRADQLAAGCAAWQDADRPAKNPNRPAKDLDRHDAS